MGLPRSLAYCNGLYASRPQTVLSAHILYWARNILYQGHLRHTARLVAFTDAPSQYALTKFYTLALEGQVAHDGSDGLLFMALPP
jgi:hypothetical protein